MHAGTLKVFTSFKLLRRLMHAFSLPPWVLFVKIRTLIDWLYLSKVSLQYLSLFFFPFCPPKVESGKK